MRQPMPLDGGPVISSDTTPQSTIARTIVNLATIAVYVVARIGLVRLTGQASGEI